MPRYVPKNFTAIIAELVADNDRAKAIVGGAFLDAALAEAISYRLRPMTESEENQLFSETGPFGTCDSKIQGAYALGLCGPRVKRDLQLINKIRNIFAHNMNPVSFDDPEVASRCKEIYTGTNSESHQSAMWREKFVLAVQLIAEDLFFESGSDENPDTITRPPEPQRLE